MYRLVCCVLVRMRMISYLNRSLLFANIVGLQLLWLWQCSADWRPETTAGIRGRLWSYLQYHANHYSDSDDNDDDDNISLFSILTVT